MSELAEYHAAAMVHIARQSPEGINKPRENLRDILAKYLELPVSEEEVSAALKILNRCDIAYSETDDFAGTFVVISRDKFDGFLVRVAREREKYDSIVKAAPDDHLGINRAEDADLPYLTAYNKFTVLRKYSAFGADWLESAVAEIRRRTSAGELDLPPTDRVIRFDQSDANLIAVKKAAEDLRAQLTTGNDLGNLSKEQAEAAISEVEQLQVALTKEVVRPAELRRKARETLSWIGEKAAGTLVGQAATTLFKLIMHLLGIST